MKKNRRIYVDKKKKSPLLYVALAAVIVVIFILGVTFSKKIVQTGNTNVKDDVFSEVNPYEIDPKNDTSNPRLSAETNGDETQGNVTSYSEEPPVVTEPLIMIDPGHGGFDDGCKVGDVAEKDVNFSISLKLKALLEEKEYKVVMTRYEDVKIYLEERVQAALDQNATLFVSIHQNLYDGAEKESVAGIETYYSSFYAAEDSEKLANMVQSSLVASTGARNRGVVDVDNLVVVVRNECPAVLIETGFLSNSKERKLLTSEEYQDKIAAAIAEAIDEFHKEKKNLDK